MKIDFSKKKVSIVEKIFNLINIISLNNNSDYSSRDKSYFNFNAQNFFNLLLNFPIKWLFQIEKDIFE